MPLSGNDPAFPVPDQRDPVTGAGIMQGSPGLSKRDYFAAAALSLIGGRRWDDVASDMRLIQTWAVSAYAIADALIAASNTGGHHG